MMNGNLVVLPSGWMNYAARAGTVVGDQLRATFIGDLLGILGDTRLLWVPKITETTTSTDHSRNARVITYDATVASRYTALGSGLAVTFNGTSGEADTPDVANLSFGDGAVDDPFSIIALVNVTADTDQKHILAKYTDSTDAQREWRLYLDATEKLAAYLFDESVDTAIGRLYNTALTAATWYLVSMTYDGSAQAAGIRLYSNAARVDDTDNSSGTYVAMENGTGKVGLGAIQSVAGADSHWNGSLAFAALSAGVVGQEAQWEIKSLVNAYYGLSL